MDTTDSFQNAFSSENIPEGTLVEVHIASNRHSSDVNIDNPAIDAERCCHGCVLAVLGEPPNCLCEVQTFTGSKVSVPVECVKHFDPGPSERGGFDLVWPEDLFLEFGVALARQLHEKGFCVIQSFGSEEAHHEMQKIAANKVFKRLKPPIEEGYLGCNSFSTISWIDEEDANSDAMALYCWYAANLNAILSRVSEDYLGFTAGDSCIETMLRQECENEEEHLQLDEGSLTFDDVEAGMVKRYLQFVQQRQICVMYVIEGDEGEIELHPREDLDWEHACLALRKNRILLFNNDLMRYSCHSSGKSLILQTWIAEKVPALAVKEFTGNFSQIDEAFGVLRPLAPPPINGSGRTSVQISSLCPRWGGGGLDWQKAMIAFVACVDGYVVIPNERFDMDFYYDDDGGLGKTRTKHSSLLSLDELTSFDCDFFGVTYEDAAVWTILKRRAIENGYETCYRAGYDQKSLRGMRMGHFLAATQDAETYLGGHITAYFNFWAGITGRAVQIETACSSALVSIILATEEIDKKDSERHIVQGGTPLLDIGTYVAMSSGRMISSKGRSRTFDHSADGYGRGEGIVGVLLERVNDRKVDGFLQITCCAMGQDGRSASITAPSGPAQTEIIKNCMKSAGLRGCDVSAHEYHGTGTSLGDPIEVGSMHIALIGADLSSPPALTGAKASVGHLELGAGLVGTLKVAMEAYMQVIHPQAHLHQLNEHFAVDGWPHLMPIELGEKKTSASNYGVSSFGMGGTNCRADYWGQGRQGQYAYENMKKLNVERLSFIHIPCPRCEGPMCWICKVAVPSKHMDTQLHHCSAIRDDFASYDYCSNCYEGRYEFSNALGDIGHTGQKVWVCGSWQLGGLTEMEHLSTGEWEVVFTLGETLCETFYLLLDRDENQTIYPVVDNANQVKSIRGPDEWNRKKWLIDGRDELIPAGTPFRVTFSWGASRKTIRWEPLSKIPRGLAVASYAHTYSIRGSWTDDTFVKMAYKEDEECWSTFGIIRQDAYADFHFARDGDPEQMIYPSQASCEDPEVSVEGPDKNGENKKWLVKGNIWEKFKICLKVSNGVIQVKLVQDGREAVTWTNKSGRSRHSFYVSGSWHHWGLERMIEDEEDLGIYRYRTSIGHNRYEEFQIIVDKDSEKTMYPAVHRSEPGKGFVCGPDASSEGNCWRMFGFPGLGLEITLNLYADDRRHIVTCTQFFKTGSQPSLGNKEETLLTHLV